MKLTFAVQEKTDISQYMPLGPGSSDLNNVNDVHLSWMRQ
jgi:hypothetical protein